MQNILHMKPPAQVKHCLVPAHYRHKYLYPGKLAIVTLVQVVQKETMLCLCVFTVYYYIQSILQVLKPYNVG